MLSQSHSTVFLYPLAISRMGAVHIQSVTGHKCIINKVLIKKQPSKQLSNGDTLVFPLLNLFMRTVIHQGCFLLILLKEALNRFGCLS